MRSLSDYHNDYILPTYCLYKCALPKGIVKQVGCSFALSFAISIILFPRAISSALYLSTAAAVASLVHAFTTPIFSIITNKTAPLSWKEEACKRTVCVLLSNCICAPFLKCQYDLSGCIGSIILNILLGTKAYSQREAALFVMY